MNLDDELQSALQRQPAPESLRARVMAQVAAEPDRQQKTHRVVLARLAASLILVSLVAVGGARYANETRERREGEAAKEQLLLALRITSEKTRIATAVFEPAHTR